MKQAISTTNSEGILVC